jgi:hypothetical protein
LRIVNECTRKSLVGGEVGAKEARHIVDCATDLPAFDDLVEGSEALLLK